jgi:hypothetical protein
MLLSMAVFAGRLRLALRLVFVIELYAMPDDLARFAGSEALLLVVFLLKMLTIVDVNCVLVDSAYKISEGKQAESRISRTKTPVDGMPSI